MGSINEVDSTIYQADTDDMGNPFEVAGRMVSIMSPIHCKTGSDTATHCFARSGDSGSPVFDYEGRLFGMYQAFEIPPSVPAKPLSRPPSTGDVHFVQRIDLVREDVERVLRSDPANAGYDVELEWYSSGD